MKKIALFLTSLLFLIFGCSKKSESVSFATASFDEQKAAGASLSMRSAKQFAVDDEMPAEFESAEEEADIEEGTLGTSFERKLIRTGSVNLEVESLREAREKAEEWVKSFGGYITSSSESGNYLSISARIPRSHFDEAMVATGKFGRMISKNVYSRDVTEQFYDLSSRLKTKEVMLSRLQSYLEVAKDVKDMIQIESKLNEVTSDLEVMRGQMNRLSGQIEYSTVDLSMSLPVNRTEDGFVLPDARSKIRAFVGNVLAFFVGLFFAILYVIVFGVPLVLLSALIFFLCFGKIGLIRKLFARLKK